VRPTELLRAIRVQAAKPVTRPLPTREDLLCSKRTRVRDSDYTSAEFVDVAPLIATQPFAAKFVDASEVLLRRKIPQQVHGR
jgi:hypothetical protein